MNEEITIINTNTRNEKLKKFFVNNKKSLTIGSLFILTLIIGYLSFNEMKKQKKIKLANDFNITIINFKTESQILTIRKLQKIVQSNDNTYSPLALYFLIDNQLMDKKEINILFDLVISKIKVDKEIKNLIIYKKGLFNSDFSSENDLLQILNPLINSKSIWKSHALYLLAEYFYSKDEKEKSKEFFKQILLLSDANIDIKKESQKRLNRDLGE